MANLNKELAASREAEAALRAQLEELASFQTLPEKVDNLMKQVRLPNIYRRSDTEKSSTSQSNDFTLCLRFVS